jgi:hypothetical protein
MDTTENPSRQDILTASEESVSEFMDSMGPDDIYRQILLEELFKLLLKGK